MKNTDYITQAMKLQEDLLNEHAMRLKDAKDKASSIGKQLAVHMALIGMLGPNDKDYVHWVKESANFCKQIDNIKVKRINKLDMDFLIDEFMYHLDTDTDAEIEVNSAWIEHEMPSILSYDFTRKNFNQFKEFRNACFEQLTQLFVQKEDHTQEFFEVFIDIMVRKYFK